MAEKYRYRVCTARAHDEDPINPGWAYFNAYCDEEACATAERLTGQDLAALILQTYDADFRFWDSAIPTYA